MSRDTRQPNQPAGDHPAGTTLGFLFYTPLYSQTTWRQISTGDHSNPSAPASQSLVPLHDLNRTPLTAVAQTLMASSAASSAGHKRLAPGVPDVSGWSSIVFESHPTIAHRDFPEGSRDGQYSGSCFWPSRALFELAI